LAAEKVMTNATVGDAIRRRRTTLASLAALGIALANPVWAARPAPGSIGVNVNALHSWGDQIPFIDVFKESAFWTLQSPTSASKVPQLDSNGWVSQLGPGEYAETSIFTGSAPHYPAGRYTLTYEGRGTLTVGGQGVTVLESSPGRMLLDVQPTTGPHNGIQIRETAVDPGSPIKNIRVLLPGYTAVPKDNPFNPAFLEVLRPFKVLRFIGWDYANRSDVTTWSDERPVTYATQSSPVAVVQKMSGAALEYQIQLANILHKDPWFMVPLKADDDYLRRMAELVHARLDPTLHPYVELSNEVWNKAFQENAYARDMGEKLGLDSDPDKAGTKWYVTQALHVFDVWRSVYGADSSRIVRVLGGVFFLPPMTDLELSYQDAYKHIDALAIGLYIMPKFLNDYAALARMTSDEVLDGVQAEVAGKMRDFAGYHLGFAKKYGVDLVVYEGGPHLWAPHAPPELQSHIMETLRQAVESPRMAGLYRQMLDNWFSAGGSLFNHFVDCAAPSPYGIFGLVEYQSEDPSQSAIFEMLKSYIDSDRGAAMHAGTATNGAAPNP
jgi:hypothetical protein